MFYPSSPLDITLWVPGASTFKCLRQPEPAIVLFCRLCHCRSRQPHPSELLVTLDQIDPEVLAELPKELQQELRAALPGRARASKQQGPGYNASRHGAAGLSRGQAGGGVSGGGGSARLCSQDPECLVEGHQLQAPAMVGKAGAARPVPVQGAGQLPAGQQQQQKWHWRHVGLGRAWKQQQRQQQLRLFAEEPVSAILSAMQVALQALAPAAQQLPEATPLPGAAVAVIAAEAVGREGGEKDAARKLAVLGEFVAQWLVAHADSDLSSVRRVLRGVAQAGEEYVGFREVAVRVVEVVQQRVQQRYGFTVAMAG